MTSNLEKKIIFFWSINICLIPALLVSGPFLSDLSLSICSISYLIFMIFKKKFTDLKNIFFIFFFIFYLTLILSSLLSNNTLFSLHSSIPYLRFVIFVFCFCYVLRVEVKLLKKIFLVLSLTYAILVFDGYLQFFTGTNILNYPKMGVRVSSLFGDEHVLGSYAVRFLPIYIAVFLFISRLNKINLSLKFLFIISILLISLLIMFSGERTALGYLFLLFFLLLIFIKGFKKIKIFFLFFIILFCILVSYFSPKNFNRIYHETRDQIISKEKIYFYGPLRHEYLLVSLNIFNDNFFLGSGPRTYRIVCGDNKYKISDLSCNNHPHNIYVQLLAETGVMGGFFFTLFFLFFLISILKQFFQQQAKTTSYTSKYNVNVCLLSAIILNFFPFLPSGNFFNNWISIIYFYPVALYLALNHYRQQTIKKPLQI